MPTRCTIARILSMMALSGLLIPADAEEEWPILVLIPLGRVPKLQVEGVRRALARTYAVRVVVRPARSLPQAAYYPDRRRYRADRLIGWLTRESNAGKTLALTTVDVSTTAHGRKDWGIAGLAQLGGRAGVVSSFRTKGRRNRFEDVAVHEAGHLFGRPHCPTPGCLMHDAEGRLANTGTSLRDECRKVLKAWLR